jgi:hypothetical protein
MTRHGEMDNPAPFVSQDYEYVQPRKPMVGTVKKSTDTILLM